MKMVDILSLILPEVAGCPQQTARIAVVRAAQELCKVSGVWREWLAPVALLDGTTEYQIEPNESGLIDMVREVWVGSTQIDPITHSELAYQMPDWRTRRSNVPRYFNVDGPRDTITVYPTPEGATGEMRIKATLIPSLTATSISDDVFNFYGEAIEKGAKAKLMMQRGTQWYEPKLGAVFKEEFEIAVASARIDEEAGQVPSTTTVRPRAFG